MIQLLDQACILQRPLSTPNTQSNYPSVKFHHAAHVSDEDWPEPSPPIAYDEPENMNQYNDQQRLYSSTRATPTLNPRLTTVEKTMDFHHPIQYDDQQRYGQYPAQPISSQHVYDHPWDSSTRPYPGHHRMASYVSPPIASVDLTEKYYKGPCPTILYFHNRDPSEFARFKNGLGQSLAI